MKKNKLLILALSVAVLSNVSLYYYYEGTAVAQTSSFNTYTKTFNSPSEIRAIEQTENAKDCSKLHTNFDDSSGRTGTLVFTCDSRDAPIEPSRLLNREQLLQELAAERNVQLTGLPIP